MKKIISVLLTSVILLSVMSISVFAVQDGSIDMSGGVEGLNNTINGTVDGDQFGLNIFRLGDDFSESVDVLLDYWNKDNPGGIIFDLDAGGQPLNELRLYMGDCSAGELLSAVVTVVNDDNRQVQPITLRKEAGSMMIDVATLEHLGKVIEPNSLDHIESTGEILDIFNSLKATEIITVFEVIPYSELKDGDITPEQAAALTAALPDTAKTMYFVRSKLFVNNGKELIEITDNSGTLTNTINNVYADYSDDTDVGSKYVLHITPDGKTVTNIAGKERLYDSLVFRTHLLGEFFVVDSPDAAPVAEEEPDAPEPLPYYYFAKTVTDDLVGATATLDKSKGLLRTDKITLTVKPNLGRKFVTPPEVKVKQWNEAMADVGPATLQPDGSYTYEVTNFRTNVTLMISGAAEVDVEAPVASIKITKLPDKLVYDWSSKELDTTGLVIEAFYADGTSAGIVDNSSVDFTGFDTSKDGAKTITANYDGYTATFEIKVEFTFWQWLLYIICFGWIWM